MASEFSRLTKSHTGILLRSEVCTKYLYENTCLLSFPGLFMPRHPPAPRCFGSFLTIKPKVKILDTGVPHAAECLQCPSSFMVIYLRALSTTSTRGTGFPGG